MDYLLDANIFIQAQNQHYSMDFCPAFWDFIKKEADNKIIISTDMVYDELKMYNDEVSQWVVEHRDLIFTISSEDSIIQKRFMDIANFVSNHHRYKESEKIRFLDGADPWLIATASTLNLTIVTHEVLVPINSTKVKIPNVAREFNVTCITPYKMIRDLGVEFVL